MIKLQGHWKNQVWVVWGVGVSGVAAAQLLHKLGAKVYAVNRGPVATWPNSKTLIDLLPPEQLIDQELCPFDKLPEKPCGVILSPGIPRDHEWIAAAEKNAVVLWNEMELAYRVRPLPILAITGTNGKTTTTTLLGHILKQAGKKVFVGGNIGKAYCQGVLEELAGDLSYDVAVIEVSSFQLESLFSWQATHSAILNITPSHGERYHLPYDYARAKANLILLTKGTGKVYIPQHCELLQQCLEHIPEHGGLVKIPVEAKDIKDAMDEFLPTSQVPLLGNHNLSNTLYACRLAKAVGLNSKEIASGVKSFAALHHRCEPIVQNQNMLIVNDSKSTNWDSTITALQAMQGRGAITLVIGGKLRGRNDEPTPDIVQQIYVLAQKIILFGEASTILQPFFKSAEVLKKIDDLRNTFLPDFKKGVLLFSPAFPSFDVYKNYEERGDHFRKVISDYFSSR